MAISNGKASSPVLGEEDGEEDGDGEEMAASSEEMASSAVEVVIGNPNF